ncbi:MAG: hypothetical protein ACYDBB_07355 [Armatimonadota bacterium]
MKKLLILGIAIAVASAAFAYPTVSGPTGGFQVPTADTAQGVQVAMDRSEGDYAEWPNTQLLWGVMPNLEVGVGYVKNQSNMEGFGLGILGIFGTVWNVDAKYALPLDLAGGKLAVGAVYEKNQTVGFHAWNAYLAGTWTVLGDLKFTGNILYSKPEEGDSNTDFLVAVAKPFANGAELGAEIDFNAPDPFFGPVPLNQTSGFSRASVISLISSDGVFANVYYIFPVNDNLSARVALAGLGQATTWNLSAAYAFGK